MFPAAKIRGARLASSSDPPARPVIGERPPLPRRHHRLGGPAYEPHDEALGLLVGGLLGQSVGGDDSNLSETSLAKNQTDSMSMKGARDDQERRGRREPRDIRNLEESPGLFNGAAGSGLEFR